MPVYFLLFFVLGLHGGASVTDDAGRVRKAVEKSTLDQPGTRPFHLKATVGPIRSKTGGADKTGTIEFWWEAPDKWRREVKSTEFSQVEVVDGGKDWQKNDGDYFPEWLREAAVSVVRPVPELEEVLDKVKGSEVRVLFGSTHYSWTAMGTDGAVSKGIGQGISITKDGEYAGGGGIGWSSYFTRTRDNDEGILNFHGRKIARKIGSVEITALEDLKNPDAAFFAIPPEPGMPLLKTLVLDEPQERRNLLPFADVAWLPVAQGPLEGVTIAEVVIGRDGAVHETLALLSDNPALNKTFSDTISRMRFKPALVDGQPVQVVTTITMPFKTVRSVGVEEFGPSKAYFDRARKLAYPTAESGTPYASTAEFETGLGNGQVAKGTYSDIWLNDDEWKREAMIADSRLARSRDGVKRYLRADGSDAPVLGFVLDALEPVPDTDSWFEPEWRFTHETVGGTDTIRIARGEEGSNLYGFWFDGSGRLVKMHSRGGDYLFSDFEEFGGRQVPRLVRIYRGTTLAVQIRVKSVQAPNPGGPATFAMPGYEWTRQFTPERR